MAPTAPGNPFSGVAHPVSHPWKWFFQGRLKSSPALENLFIPFKFRIPFKILFPAKPKFGIPFKFGIHFPPSQNLEFHSNLEFISRQAKIWNSIQISVSRQFIIIRFPLYLIILFFISRPFSHVKQLHDSIQVFKILFPLYLNLCFPANFHLS